MFKVQQAYEVERAIWDYLLQLTVPGEKGKGKPKKALLQKYNKSPGTLIAHGWINDQETHAIPDTGAEYNIIDASFATKIGLVVQDHNMGDEILLRMANGKHIKTCGIVEANWCFSTLTYEDDNVYRPSLLQREGSWRLLFYVLSDFVYDLVLGSDFLMKTETMSRLKERLSRVPRPLNALSVLRVNLMGAPSQRVRGTLGNDKILLALPDSGSEPNLLSWDYVKQWKRAVMSIDIRDQRLIQFADGSLGKTEGSIIAHWHFAPRKSIIKSPDVVQSLQVEFHVLSDCPYDAILGQDVLEETDTFLDHQDAIENVEFDNGASAMNLVVFARTKKIKSDQVADSNSNAGINVNYSLHDELQRRAAVDRQRRREHINDDHPPKSRRASFSKRVPEGSSIQDDIKLCRQKGFIKTEIESEAELNAWLKNPTRREEVDGGYRPGS